MVLIPLLFLLFSLVIPFAWAQNFAVEPPTSSFPIPCPFNEHFCSCYPVESDDGIARLHTFQSADCILQESTSLAASLRFPEFSSSNINYTIVDTLRIVWNASRITNGHFARFQSIGTLDLYDLGNNLQNWDEFAFHRVRIDQLRTYNLRGVLPPGPALRELAHRGDLRRLTVHNGSVARLGDGVFGDFTNLRSLSINNENFQRPLNISKKAFDGLESSLDELILERTILAGKLPRAIGSLRDLKSLVLHDIDLRRISSGFFRNLSTTNLTHVSLSGFDLSGSIEQFQPPIGLVSLSLKNLNLTSIPSKIVRANSKSLINLDLSQNRIRNLRRADLANLSKLESLILSENPIVEIERGAFEGLTSLNQLKVINTNLSVLDLSTLEGVKGACKIDLSKNQALKRITASDLDKVPKGLRIHLFATGLRTIDSKLAPLFEEEHAAPGSIEFEFYMNYNLECRTLSWLAPYLVCARREKPTEAARGDLSACSDLGVIFQLYIHEIAPAPICPYRRKKPPILKDSGNGKSSSNKLILGLGLAAVARIRMILRQM